MNILIYTDNVSNNHILYYALGKLCGKQSVHFVNANQILAGVLSSAIDLLVMPGGASRYKAAKLKGKANEIKHLGPVLVKVWSAYMSQRMDLHKKVLTMLQLSAHLDVIIDATPGFGFDHASAVDLVSTGFAYLALFYEMSAEFKDEPVALFSLTAKAHYLMHICLLSRSCNFIGWVSLACCACVWVCSVVLVFARAC